MRAKRALQTLLGAANQGLGRADDLRRFVSRQAINQHQAKRGDSLFPAHAMSCYQLLQITSRHNFAPMHSPMSRYPAASIIHERGEMVCFDIDRQDHQ